MFNVFSSLFSRGAESSQGALDRPDSGFWGSRESSMEVDSLTASMANMNGTGSMWSRNGANNGGIVLTAGIGTDRPLPQGQGIPGMDSETRVVMPDTGVERPVSRNVQNSGRIIGNITISNERSEQQREQMYGRPSSDTSCHRPGGNHGHQRPDHRPPQVPSTPSTMIINVRNSFKSNRIQAFRVNTNARVDDLMALIQKELGIPPDQQRLLFGPKQLEKGHTLKSYELKDGDRIELLGRLRGG